MTEWEKLKVVELKEECKSRNISITGLKLKQQYVDKLVEYESTSQDATQAEESVEDRTNGAFEEVEKNDSQETDKASTTPPVRDADDAQHKHDIDRDVTEDVPLAVEADKHLPSNRPAALKVEDSQDDSGEAEDDVPMADTTQEAKDIEKNDMLIPEPEQIEVSKDVAMDESSQDAQPDQDDAKMSNTESDKLEALKRSPTPTAIIDEMNADAENATPSNDALRKRKRRSATPPPDAQEIRKKAKGEHGGAIFTKPTSPAADIESSSKAEIEEARKTSEDETQGPLAPTAEASDSEPRPADNETKRSPTPVRDNDKLTEPALHAATRSLYMRNFKRPLNVPTLRSHVSTIAQGTSSQAPDEDTIKFWYMNNIRSHAFVTFSNISAASRVRAAMHQTRFPDEPQRDALWIDFVPDDTIEDWVEQETGSSRGQRNSGSKFEVVYNDNGDGYEAVFQEVGAARGPPQRPSISATITNRSSFSQRQSSYTADPSRTAVVASDVHPDRAALVPQNHQERARSPARTATPQKPHADQGKGFGALDDLFSHTTAKPKLYFKEVSQDVVDDRLDMVRDLYPDRGVSGDAGMKRFTFERQNGRDEWVDNGPEFGHGKRGQDRLAGVGGRGRGGYRGRGRGGGEGRFYGGDSYRGGGRR